MEAYQGSQVHIKGRVPAPRPPPQSLELPASTTAGPSGGSSAAQATAKWEAQNKKPRREDTDTSSAMSRAKTLSKPHTFPDTGPYEGSKLLNRPIGVSCCLYFLEAQRTWILKKKLSRGQKILAIKAPRPPSIWPPCPEYCWKLT